MAWNSDPGNRLFVSTRPAEYPAPCSSSRLVIAINKDLGVQIFNDAEYGILRGPREMVRTLIERVKTLRKNS
ncbi:MAG: hypothetical protein JXL84_07885 [Deltaproteobacteria bacterium]|nr:hypothetical protein [Deltaproteobacteria bacterium]